jgi:hypothetical protein
MQEKIQCAKNNVLWEGRFKMKRILLLSAGISLLSIGAFAESWNGTLVDVMCKGKDLASHTTKCAVGCAQGGYGLVLSAG